MESVKVISIQDVLFVPGLRYSVISISIIQRKGFEVLFQDGKARIRTRGSKPDGIVLRVREHGLYKLTTKPVDHGKKQAEQVQVPKKKEQV